MAVLLSVSVIAHLGAAQETASRFYVARTVGAWVIVDGKKTQPMRVLDGVSPSTIIAVDPQARVDTAFEIVLRDPRTLRTARWRCSPVARCTGTHRVADFTFDAGTLKTSARTGALFVHIGETSEERSRGRLLGARGVVRSWGVVVLAADSGRLDLAPLIARAEATDEDLIARICVIASLESAVDARCSTEQKLSANDCVLVLANRCTFNRLRRDEAVRIEIFPRIDSLIATFPVARVYGVVTSSLMRARFLEEADTFKRDLDALASSITPEERTALERAFVFRIAPSSR